MQPPRRPHHLPVFEFSTFFKYRADVPNAFGPPLEPSEELEKSEAIKAALKMRSVHPCEPCEEVYL